MFIHCICATYSHVCFYYKTTRIKMNTLPEHIEHQDPPQSVYKSEYGYYLPYYPEGRQKLITPAFMVSADESQSRAHNTMVKRQLSALMAAGLPGVMFSKDRVYSSLKELCKEYGYYLKELPVQEALAFLGTQRRMEEGKSHTEVMQLSHAISKLVQNLTTPLPSNPDNKTVLVITGYDFEYVAGGVLDTMEEELRELKEMLSQEVSPKYLRDKEIEEDLIRMMRKYGMTLSKETIAEVVSDKVYEDLTSQIEKKFNQAKEYWLTAKDPEEKAFQKERSATLHRLLLKIEKIESDVYHKEWKGVSEKALQYAFDHCQKWEDVIRGKTIEVYREALLPKYNELENKYAQARDKNVVYNTLMHSAVHRPYDPMDERSHLHRSNGMPYVVFLNPKVKDPKSFVSPLPMVKGSLDELGEKQAAYPIGESPNPYGHIAIMDSMPVWRDIKRELHRAYDQLEKLPKNKVAERVEELKVIEEFIDRVRPLWDATRQQDAASIQSMMLGAVELCYSPAEGYKKESIVRFIEGVFKAEGRMKVFVSSIKQLMKGVIEKGPEKALMDDVYKQVVQHHITLDSPLLGSVLHRFPEQQKKEIEALIIAQKASSAMVQYMQEIYNRRMQFRMEFHGEKMPEEVIVERYGLLEAIDLKKFRERFEYIKETRKKGTVRVPKVEDRKGVFRMMDVVEGRILSIPQDLRSLCELLFTMADHKVEGAGDDALHLKEEIFSYILELRDGHEPLQLLAQMREEVGMLEEKYTEEQGLLYMSSPRKLESKAISVEVGNARIKTDILYRLHDVITGIKKGYLTSLQQEHYDVLSSLTFPAFEDYRTNKGYHIQSDLWTHVMAQVEMFFLYTYSLQGESASHKHNIYSEIFTKDKVQQGHITHMYMSTMPPEVLAILERAQAALLILTLRGDGTIEADELRRMYYNDYKAASSMISYLILSTMGVDGIVAETVRNMAFDEDYVVSASLVLQRALLTSLRGCSESTWQRWYDKCTHKELTPRDRLRSMEGQQSVSSYELRLELLEKLKGQGEEQVYEGILESL